MPPKATSNVHNALPYATQKEHLASIEERLTLFQQLHENVEQRVKNVEEHTKALTEKVDANSAVAIDNNAMLKALTLCIVGLDERGLKRKGLAEDVAEVLTRVNNSDTRLNSLEESRTRTGWLVGIASTILSIFGGYILTHQNTFLAIINDAKPKTEAPAPTTSK